MGRAAPRDTIDIIAFGSTWFQSAVMNFLILYNHTEKEILLLGLKLILSYSVKENHSWMFPILIFTS